MKRRILSLLTVIFAGLFIVSNIFIFNHFWQERKSKKLYEGLAQMTQNSGQEENEKPTLFFNGKAVLPEYEELFGQNDDMVGWMYVPDTKINYPVVQTPDAPNYYLRRGFDGEYAMCGCLYVQENCDITAPSDNLVIYGHNMNNGTMFGELKKFMDKAFWEQHKTIFFNTLTDRQEYEVVAVFKTFVNSDSPEAFKYYQFVNAQDEHEYDAFIRRCKDLALYDTGVTAEYGEKLITLSTCEYSHENGRLVLVAKRLEA